MRLAKLCGGKVNVSVIMQHQLCSVESTHVCVIVVTTKRKYVLGFLPFFLDMSLSYFRKSNVSKFNLSARSYIYYIIKALISVKYFIFTERLLYIYNYFVFKICL